MTNIAVVGLGKIGLPLAALFAGKGASVIGCDTDAAVVEAVNAGRSPVGGEPGLAEAVAKAQATGALRATADTTAAVAESDVVVIVVRVDIDDAGRVDFGRLDAAASAIARGLRPGTLVILESTVPVGATRRHLGSRLQIESGLRASAPSALRPGSGQASSERAFRLAYSPERVSSGSVFRDLATYPKLVGGVDTASGEASAAFYREMLDAEVLVLPDAETAEFAKLAEAVYRDVNIALANELARAAETLGVDYAAAARAANSQPYSHLHDPGVGVGGHCIPVYPHFLLGATEAPLVKLARQVNDAMAVHAADRLEVALDRGLAEKTVLILGLAYRGGVKEAGHSSALLLAEELGRRRARVLVHDPLFEAEEIEAYGLEAGAWPPAGRVDAIVLQAMHAEYHDLDLALAKGCRVFLDGRGAFDRARVETAGMRYIGIGAGA